MKKYVVVALTWGDTETGGSSMWTHAFSNRSAAEEVASWLNSKDIVHGAKVFEDDDGEEKIEAATEVPVPVNNYRWGIYQDGEVYIQTEPHQLKANQGRVYLTTIELKHLLRALERSGT